MMRCYAGMWSWVSQLLGVVISVRYPRYPGGIQCDHTSKQNSCQDDEIIEQRRLAVALGPRVSSRLAGELSPESS
ncbi:hypothetical protein BC826DRAFT_1049389 [Russula brevipes]|nr:hypothetical protein BC826DRAFT_1049389 [Russula brevipes]